MALAFHFFYGVASMSISNWIARIRKYAESSEAFNTVNLEEAHRVIYPVVDAALNPRGFEAVSPLKWVRFDGSPIRQIFAFPAWKGGVIAPRWGLSIDFVPHVSGSSVRWHRTNKSAIFDLAVDARDRDLDISVIRGERFVAEKSSTVVEASIARADEFWRPVNSVEDVVGAFEWLRSHLANGGLGFYNYTQHPIALAFVLARIGDADGARRELDRFLEGRSAEDPVSLQLGRMLTRATSIA
ncbi:hypothetical protein FOB72_06720 [Cupriavidus pauculus]|uniref:DUF4304 domain-containing protein n=1 Tax=Cupriavidus pauculus TaxID=82633 RepID=A0A5P2H1S8_9BURK|nr:hypothetical protein [Cupriavidus pauculus]QET01768.1 hypothetical protein FOB72_06720 [Cupriavidus pauculus]